MRETSILKRTFAVIICFLVVLAFIPVLSGTGAVNAAEKSYKPIKLKSNKVYKKWDITGDGKKDKLKIKYIPYLSPNNKGGYMTRSYFMVNGKNKGLFHGGKMHTTSIMPNGKRKYLVIESQYTGKGNSLDIYCYMKGKFCKAYGGKYYALGNGTLAFTKNCKYTKNMIQVISHSGLYDRELISAYKAIPCKFLVTYNIKRNGKLGLKSKYCPVIGNRSYIANVSFITGSAAGVDDSEGVYVDSSDKVELLQMYILGKSGYEIQIRVNGKMGWINSSSYADNTGWDDDYLLY